MPRAINADVEQRGAPCRLLSIPSVGAPFSYGLQQGKRCYSVKGVLDVL